MDPNNDIDELQSASYVPPPEDDTVSVDDFIRQLEAKEKDLHITSDTSVIEIDEAFSEDLSVQMLETLGLPMVPPPAVNNPVPDRSQELRALQEENASLRARIEKMEADREEIFENSQRRAKDFESFKTRSERERQETFQNQIVNVATLMLPALDNLNRALESAEDIPGEKPETFQHFFEGISLVNEQIGDILVKMGLRAIRTIGEEFDPHYHEAVATEETDEFAPNIICGELIRGYIAGDRVIRHSLVKVAKPAANKLVDEINDPAEENELDSQDPLSI